MGGFVGAILFALCFFAGKGLVYLGYGKKGYTALKELEDGLPKIPCVVFSVLFFVWAFWGVFFYFSFRENGCLWIVIGGIIVYALWFLYARSTVPTLLAQLEKVQHLRDSGVNNAEGKSLGIQPQREAQPGDWQCTCGRVNPKYISTCACGINRRQLKKNQDEQNPS